MIHHELFAHMTQTLDRLGKEFEVTNSIDEELSLLEKYLSIKEMSEEITGELKKLNEKIRQFEKDHGLLDMDLHAMKDTDTMTEKDSEVVIKLDEEDFITFQKGIGFFDLWMYDQAILHLETTTKKYPDFNLARLYTAMTYFKKKEYAYSKREILILFKYSDDPDLLSLGHNLLGMIYGLKRDEEQAIYHFKKAIELKKNWTEPIFNLAMLYYQTKHYHESISYLKELAQINTNDWEVLFYLGKAYQKLGKYDQAIEWLKKTYTIAKQPMIVRQIAVNFEKRLHFEQATQWYKKWLELEPFQPEALLGLAKNEWLKGNKETGMVLLKQALSIKRDDPEGLLLFAWMKTDAFDHKQALRALNHLFQLNDGNSIFSSYIIANLARLYYLNRNQLKTDQFCSILLSSSDLRVSGLGHIVKGLIYLDQNQPSKSLEHLEKALMAGIKFPFLDFYLGYNHYLLGHVEEAKNSWLKLIH